MAGRKEGNNLGVDEIINEYKRKTAKSGEKVKKQEIQKNIKLIQIQKKKRKKGLFEYKKQTFIGPSNMLLLLNIHQ